MTLSLNVSFALKASRDEARLFPGPGAASDYIDVLESFFGDQNPMLASFGQAYPEIFEDVCEDASFSSNWNEYSYSVQPAHDRMEGAAIVVVHFVGGRRGYV